MSRVITDLHPKLQKKIAKLIAECEKEGLKISITSCIRNAAEQLDCFNRGTSSLKYPNSMHNWGTAFDFCRNDGKGAYNDSDGFFTKVGKIAMGLGLIWGGSWNKPDKPHCQLSDWGVGTAKLKSTYGTPEKFKKTWSESIVAEPKKVVKKETSLTVKTKTLPLKCRASAKVTGKKLGSFKKGTVVILIEKTNAKWYKVKGLATNGKVISGYCSSEYLK